jgi:ketosteroid isomerase-like protein
MSDHEHPNVTLVRRGYAAFGEGDMAWMMENLAPDVVWHVPGANVQSGDKEGVEATIAFFGETMQLTGGTFHLDLHDVVGGDDHVVALVTVSGNRPDGRTLHNRVAQIFHARDGKATEVWAYSEDQGAVDAFFND